MHTANQNDLRSEVRTILNENPKANLTDTLGGIKADGTVDDLIEVWQECRETSDQDSK